MDRQMDGQTDGGINNIPISFLKKHGDNNIGIPCISLYINISWVSRKLSKHEAAVRVFTYMYFP